VRWKTKHRLIYYFLSSTSAKIIVIGSYVSRLYQVKNGTFFERQCTSCHRCVHIYMCTYIPITGFIGLWQPYKARFDKHALIHTSQRNKITHQKTPSMVLRIMSSSLQLSLGRIQSTADVKLLCANDVGMQYLPKTLHRSF